MKISYYNSEKDCLEIRDATDEEMADIKNAANGIGFQMRNSAILAKLADIDIRTIRPLREGDAVRVAALEAEASELRAQLVKD